jgi:DNA-binding NarL/FixJ family response regulator
MGRSEFSKGTTPTSVAIRGLKRVLQLASGSPATRRRPGELCRSASILAAARHAHNTDAAFITATRTDCMTWRELAANEDLSTTALFRECRSRRGSHRAPSARAAFSEPRIRSVSEARTAALQDKTNVALTPRETAVAELVCAGHKSKEISQKLLISARTVEYHIASISSRLGISSRAQLAYWIACNPQHSHDGRRSRCHTQEGASSCSPAAGVGPSGEKTHHSTRGPALTSREKAISRLVADGKTSKQISRELYISVSTVDHQIASIRNRLNLTSRAQLAYWVARNLRTRAGVEPAR